MSKETFVRKCKEGHTFTSVLNDYSDTNLLSVEHKFSADDETRIERIWSEKISKGAVMRNESLVALLPDMTRTEDDILQLSGYATDFKHYICTKDLPTPEVWLTGPSAVTRITGRETTMYIIGERKTKNLNTGGVLEFLPGGFLKMAHLYDKNPFLSTLEEELTEETGIEKECIVDTMPLWYGKLEKFPDGRASRNVVLDYLMDIEGLTPEQVQERFKSKDREHTHLEFVPEQDLLKYGETNYGRFNTRGLCTFEQLIARKII